MESGDCKAMCSHDQKCRKRRSILRIWRGLGFNKEVIIHIETFISKVQISKQLSVQWVEWKLSDQWRQNQQIKGVISTRWPNKMAITVSLFSTTILASIHGQKWLCGSYGIQNHIPRTREESHSPMWQVMGRQTLVPAVDPERARVHPLSAVIQEPLENTNLDNHHRWGSLCGSPGLQWKAPAQHWSEKTKSDTEHTGESKRNSLTLPMSPLPKVAQLSAKGALFRLISWGTKWGRVVRAISEHLAFPAV